MNTIPSRATRASLARALFTLVDASIDNPTQLQQLYVIADGVRDYLNNNPTEPHIGIGTEIACWIGLLIDTHEMGLEYRQNVIDSFPEILGP